VSPKKSERESVEELLAVTLDTRRQIPCVLARELLRQFGALLKRLNDFAMIEDRTRSTIIR
jgi:hypothetical protein